MTIFESLSLPASPCSCVLRPSAAPLSSSSASSVGSSVGSAFPTVWLSQALFAGYVIHWPLIVYPPCSCWHLKEHSCCWTLIKTQSKSPHLFSDCGLTSHKNAKSTLNIKWSVRFLDFGCSLFSTSSAVKLKLHLFDLLWIVVDLLWQQIETSGVWALLGAIN